MRWRRDLVDSLPIRDHEPLLHAFTAAERDSEKPTRTT